DDLDPFRDFSEPFVVRGQTERLPRLTQAEAAGWQANFAAASALLERDLPRYFEPMRAGLRTIVPLTVQPMLLSASSTANSSFGCVFSSAPADSSQLALTLVHEFQHNKFDLITSQTTLVEPDRTCRFYAPWRDDPRPIMALLHGIYSFFGVAEFWRVHRTDYHQPMSAHADYEYWRVQVESAIAEALASGLLTADGERFMATLRAGMRAWRDDDVPARARRSVADVATAHRVYWRVRNARPDPAGIAEFAGHWAAGSAAPAVLPTSHPADQELLPDSYHRLPLQLALRQLDDAQSCADPESGDGALAAGDAARAVALYTHDLRADAARPQPWAGLALALPTLYPETDFAVLHARPEVVAYLYQAATARGEYSVVELVRWLTGQAAVG
ncbi:MAG: hypothetical protein HOQ24_02555, partial [Mycobacteriaceae bacterium]|nr:hypothetical protein [Mycobacteriaceae bacterium]